MSTHGSLLNLLRDPSKREDHRLTVERDGARAYCNGLRERDCPWNPISMEAKSWLMGYLSAYQDHEARTRPSTPRKKAPRKPKTTE